MNKLKCKVDPNHKTFATLHTSNENNIRLDYDTLDTYCDTCLRRLIDIHVLQAVDFDDYEEDEANNE